MNRNKTIGKTKPNKSTNFANRLERPQLVPAFIEDKNGHILPYVKFQGGSLEFANEALNILKQYQ